MKKITRAYVSHYNLIKFSQKLPSGRSVYVNWVRLEKDKWLPNYSTDSAFQICTATGDFMTCNNCKAYDEDPEKMVKNCKRIHLRQIISDNEMAQRATACINAVGCTVDFRSIDGEL